MDDLTARMADLSPDRHRLVERLLRADGTADATGAHAPSPRPPSLTADGEPGRSDAGLGAAALALGAEAAAGPEQVKAATRRFYDAVSRHLTESPAGSYAMFLNFGYAADGSPEYARVALPERCLNRNCIKLVLETIGDADVAGCRVLDVGCGRGGTVHVLATYFAPARVVGLDLSPSAIAFCRARHRFDGVEFMQGDAERLPFEDASFDVVTNVESSHSYPTIDRFYAEVARVLVPGGAFLYTDLFATADYAARTRQLAAHGLAIELERDITRNVLRSCDETARVHGQAFRYQGGAALMQSFLGVPGSQVYDEMRSGRSTYRILRARRLRG
ncbi:MAG TPA: methyltransferase domain-containing protein [Gemmatimonadaceae bacterium]|nr:methyltransferase domain-containing protein [Gemmatimonadaceae bacterium]